ncbi:MAG: hypothetical protein PHY93_17990 [Bacteriovorax sp.]|nr:hypothetical protein [Bacteriovorax sp.]
MKSLFLSLITTLALTMSTASHASQTSEVSEVSEDFTHSVPAWACNLNFKAHAVGFQVILGAFSVKGIGKLHCVSPFQEVREIPVSVNMSSKYFAPRVSMGRFDMYGSAIQINLFSNDPEDLLGLYVVAQGQGAVIAGAGALTAVRASFPHLSMNVSVQVLKGLGVNAGISKMVIEELY